MFRLRKLLKLCAHTSTNIIKLKIATCMQNAAIYYLDGDMYLAPLPSSNIIIIFVITIKVIRLN